MRADDVRLTGHPFLIVLFPMTYATQYDGGRASEIGGSTQRFAESAPVIPGLTRNPSLKSREQWWLISQRMLASAYFPSRSRDLIDLLISLCLPYSKHALA